MYLPSSSFLNVSDDGTVPLVATSARTESPDTASVTARQSARSLVAQSRSHVYSKIDSTCRGPVGAFLAGALDGCRKKVCVVSPAHPEMKRTVSEGRLSVDGRPVHLTPMADDPAAPVTTDDVVSIIRQTTSVGVERFLGDATQFLNENGPTILVADASSIADLVRIVDSRESAQDVMLAGSGGMLSVLPTVWGWQPRPPATATPTATQLLTVVGSIHPTTLRQVEVLGGVADAVVDCSGQGSSMNVIEQSRRGSNVVVTSGTMISGQDTGIELLGLLTKITRTAVVECPDLALVVTGGDTAMAVLRALKAESLLVQGAVAPGTPYSLILGGVADGRTLVTKAGGFGGENALVECVNFVLGGM